MCTRAMKYFTKKLSQKCANFEKMGKGGGGWVEVFYDLWGKGGKHGVKSPQKPLLSDGIGVGGSQWAPQRGKMGVKGGELGKIGNWGKIMCHCVMNVQNGVWVDVCLCCCVVAHFTPNLQALEATQSKESQFLPQALYCVREGIDCALDLETAGCFFTKTPCHRPRSPFYNLNTPACSLLHAGYPWTP